ncbi:MAG: hypothetical protein IPP47_33255 [Bryobacterales bacterium]|nr:hypothetical protein [Bryobacterales bacterium]
MAQIRITDTALAVTRTKNGPATAPIAGSDFPPSTRPIHAPANRPHPAAHPPTPYAIYAERTHNSHKTKVRSAAPDSRPRPIAPPCIPNAISAERTRNSHKTKPHSATLANRPHPVPPPPHSQRH